MIRRHPYSNTSLMSTVDASLGEARRQGDDHARIASPRGRRLQHDLGENCCTTVGQARSSRPMKGSTMQRTLVAASLSAAFLWTLALSASPQLHERFHPDA